MPAPDDRVVGGLSHDPRCPWCAHGHGLDPCSCGCDDHALPGIDTALTI